jgi:hypothetical protein
MLRPIRIVPLALIVAFGLAAGTGFAQTVAAQAQGPSSYPEAEAAFGWSYLHPEGGGPDSTLGGYFGANYNLAPWFGLAFDATVNHYFEGSTPAWGRTEYALLAGPRFAWRPAGPVVAYIHLLAGYGRANLDYEGTNAGEDLFLIQPGAGLDIGAGKYGARVEVSWRRMFSQAGGVNRLRVVTGIVIRSSPKAPVW